MSRLETRKLSAFACLGPKCTALSPPMLCSRCDTSSDATDDVLVDEKDEAIDIVALDGISDEFLLSAFW